MTLFWTVSGRMAIHHKLPAICDIMTLFWTGSGRMAIHHVRFVHMIIGIKMK